MKIYFAQNITMLKSILIVVMSAVFVQTSPGWSILYPSTVMRHWCFYSFPPYSCIRILHMLP